VHIFLVLQSLKLKMLFLDQHKGLSGTQGCVSWKVKRPGGI